MAYVCSLSHTYILSYLILSYLILSYLILSFLILSYKILSYVKKVYWMTVRIFYIKNQLNQLFRKILLTMILLSPDSLTLARSVRSENATERCITQGSQPHAASHFPGT
jgi:hypothetical protein